MTTRPEAQDRPHLTRSVIPEGLDAGRDRRARCASAPSRGEAIYELDRWTLEELGPDLIVTQAVCEVCAVSFDDVRAVAEELPTQPQVLSLDPSTLGEVLADIPRLAEAAGVPEAGDELAEHAGARLDGGRSGRWTASRARAWPRSSGSTRCSSAATGCRR